MAARVGVDKWLFFTTLLLVVVGLVMVFSASAVVAQERYSSPYAFVGRQAGWAFLIGRAALFAQRRLPVGNHSQPIRGARGARIEDHKEALAVGGDVESVQAVDWKIGGE